MTPQQIEDALVAMLREVAPEAPPRIDRTVNLREELDLDSMDFLAWIERIAARLGVEVPEADYAKVFTLAGAVDYVAARLPARP